MATLAIVGAGFCGTMVATHVLRAQRGEIEQVVLVERNGREIGGVAYGTPSTSHTLNVPAGRMSAFASDPDDFLRHVRDRDPALTGGSFVPRRFYGEYLHRTLTEAARSSDVELLRVAGEAIDVEVHTDGARLHLLDGRIVDADQVVLAVGNYPPSDPPAVGERLATSLRYARDPWAPDALERDRNAPVLLLGSGLTMCDIVLALRDDDQRAPILAISRRGLLPQSHRLSTKPPPHLDPPVDLDEWPATVLGLFRGLRSEVREAGERGVDWREVVTSIREQTPALWQRLDTEERRRFLRHARPYWETHRHRSSPETAFAVESMGESGALELLPGRVARLVETPTGVTLTYAARDGSPPRELVVGKVVNCTGPDTDLVRVRDPLIRALREHGAIRPDPLGLGPDTDEDGRLVTADGNPSDRLTLVGPLRKGRLWEHTAVPELRVEAQQVAERLGVGLAS